MTGALNLLARGDDSPFFLNSLHDLIGELNPVLKRLQHTEGHLLSRPTPPTEPIAPSGLHSLKLERQRDGLLYVPPTYNPEQKSPLVLMLHGAGGDAEAALRLLEGLADRYGLLLLSVASRGRTWDVIERYFGPDIETLDRALTQTFSRYAVDPQRLVIAGFSDGASYALSVGLMNGDLFTHIIAFSPGFMAPADYHGKPRLFISHGTHDPVLSIERCSRTIVPQLQRGGYDVFYREFQGGHSVPLEISDQAMAWLTSGFTP